MNIPPRPRVRFDPFAQVKQQAAEALETARAAQETTRLMVEEQKKTNEHLAALRGIFERLEATINANPPSSASE